MSINCIREIRPDETIRSRQKEGKDDAHISNVKCSKCNVKYIDSAETFHVRDGIIECWPCLLNGREGIDYYEDDEREWYEPPTFWVVLYSQALDGPPSKFKWFKYSSEAYARQRELEHQYVDIPDMQVAVIRGTKEEFEF